MFDSNGELAWAGLLIRNIDDRIIEKLKLKAELKGYSLEQELRDLAQDRS
jgi:plasmid stability protein